MAPAAVIDLHLVSAARASGHAIEAAVQQATLDHQRCRGIQRGDAVLTPEGNIGRVLLIYAASPLVPTMALVCIDWFRRVYRLNDLKRSI